MTICAVCNQPLSNFTHIIYPFVHERGNDFQATIDAGNMYAAVITQLQLTQRRNNDNNNPVYIQTRFDTNGPLVTSVVIQCCLDCENIASLLGD
jgi:uncharacterized protein (UPF0333 family)